MITSLEENVPIYWGKVACSATRIVCDSMLCPELDAYITANRHREIILIHIEREITRFELMEPIDE